MVISSSEDKEMNRLKKELEVLKSWGIESIPVDKILSMIDEVEVNENALTGEDRAGASYLPCKEESEVDAFFKGITSITIDVHPVGGTIFYIDDTADGVYEFFDACGNLIKNIKIGDRPYYYRVIKKGSKDKYYVYHDEVYDNMRWAYCKDDNYVYKSLGTSGDRGSGKTNTEIVMAEDNGAYIAENSNGYPTIWYQLQKMRDAKVGYCNDWFIPSAYEVNELRVAIKSGSITGGIIAGSSYKESVFNSKWLWSSSEYSSQSAWYWYCNSQRWGDYYKDDLISVFFTRAF